MAASVVAYTPGSGGKAHAESLTIGANTGDVPYALIFDPRFPSYNLLGEALTIATGNDHTVQLMAGTSLNLRIKSIHVEQNSNAGAAALMTFQVLRLTSAGSGGTTLTASKYDNGDSAAGATGQTNPSSKGTESTIIFRGNCTLRSAAQSTAEDAWDWHESPGLKPLIIPAGTANGIAIKSLTAVATATMNIYIEFAETSYV